jgi:hypothetical protein
MQKVTSIKQTKITTAPIIYFWYFSKEDTKKLLEPLDSCIEFDKIKFIQIDGKDYFLLYIGKAKNGHQRLIDYHILDKANYHDKGVENKRLSSLRQTISGLLNIDMSKSKDSVDDVFNNCYVDFKEVDEDILSKTEKEYIASYYLPLNDLGAITPKECRNILRALKKEYRK